MPVTLAAFSSSTSRRLTLRHAAPPQHLLGRRDQHRPLGISQTGNGVEPGGQVGDGRIDQLVKHRLELAGRVCQQQSPPVDAVHQLHVLRIPSLTRAISAGA
jgi:hypothetical protein